MEFVLGHVRGFCALHHFRFTFGPDALHLPIHCAPDKRCWQEPLHMQTHKLCVLGRRWTKGGWMDGDDLTHDWPDGWILTSNLP